MILSLKTAQNLLSRLDAERGGWVIHALCKNLTTEEKENYFFPVDERDSHAPERWELCNRCPVQNTCYNYALDTKQKFGAWGGFSEAEINRQLRDRQVH